MSTNPPLKAGSGYVVIQLAILYEAGATEVLQWRFPEPVHVMFRKTDYYFYELPYGFDYKSYENDAVAHVLRGDCKYINRVHLASEKIASVTLCSSSIIPANL